MNKKLNLALIIIIAVILVFSSLLIIEPREHTKYISETDFTSNLQVNVQANLTNNSLYSSSTLYDPGVVYQHILKNMTVYLDGTFLSSREQPVIISYAIYVDSSSPSWNKTFASNITSFTFTGSHSINHMVIPINLSYLYNQSATIDNQLGYNSAPSIVGINITVTNANNGASSSTSLTISQGNEQYLISYGKPADLTGTTQLKDSYGHQPFVNIPIIYGYIVTLLAVTALVFLIVSYIGLPRKKNKMEVILGEYGDRIIDIDVMPKGGIVRVDSFEELIKLSDAYHEPLFNIRRENMFFVSHDFKNYIFPGFGDKK